MDLAAGRQAGRKEDRAVPRSGIFTCPLPPLRSLDNQGTLGSHCTLGFRQAMQGPAVCQNWPGKTQLLEGGENFNRLTSLA